MGTFMFKLCLTHRDGVVLTGQQLVEGETRQLGDFNKVSG